jgi:hypothetical protein
MGAALGIFLVNTSPYRYNFSKLYFMIDIELMSLELLELGAFSNNLELRYGLYMFKKLGTGIAIGVNFYVAVMLIKKKCTIFTDFMRITLLLYMVYVLGLIVGMVIKEIPNVTYMPITAGFSLFRFIYLLSNPKWERMQPD